MEGIKAAIYAAYTGNGTLSGALSGGMYRGRVPASAALPYARMFVNSDVPEETYTEEGENYQIQFNIFDDTEDDDGPILELFNKLKTVYDYADLTVTGYNFIVMKRISASDAMQPEGDEVWQLSVLYEAQIQKTS